MGNVAWHGDWAAGAAAYGVLARAALLFEARAAPDLPQRGSGAAEGANFSVHRRGGLC